MKKVLTVLFLFYCCHAFATHNRSGYISYEHLGGKTYKVTVHMYTKASSVAADKDTLAVNYGDGGPMAKLSRTNGGGFGVTLGNDVLYSQYTGQHTYASYSHYIISITDPNRIGGILNINGGNSIDQPFYISTMLNVNDPQVDLGYNNSIVLTNHPVYLAAVNQPFHFTANAFEKDDDSLSFEMTVPGTGGGQVAGYESPEQISGTTGSPTFALNKATGELTWNAPQFCGIYNIAILVNEWRRIKGHAPRNVGTTLVDIELIVVCYNNHLPVSTQPKDTCLFAGNTLSVSLSATDPDAGQKVTFSANGEPFEVAADTAVFTQTSGTTATANLNWQTTCNHIAYRPYQVVYNAHDDYSLTPLVTPGNQRITVVAPPPANLTATLVGNTIKLKWDSAYSCAGGSRFAGFCIWRMENSNPFHFGVCQTGLANTVYTQVARQVKGDTFTDNHILRGRQYCYRIVAMFGYLNAFGMEVNWVESNPSEEACAAVPNTCIAYFTPYPNTSTPGNWFILNQSAGAAPINYAWTWGDGQTSTGALPSHTYTASGNYTICLTITDDTACTSTYCDTIQLNAGGGINVISSVAEHSLSGARPLVVFPNPCEVCEITGVNDTRDIYLYDVMGRRVPALFTKNSFGYRMNLQNNSPGIYILRNKKTGEAVKFVKN